MPALRPAARIYLVAILTAAAILSVVLVARSSMPGGSDLAIAAALAILLGAAYCYPLAFARHAQLNLDSSVILATVLLLPPGPAVVICLFGSLVAWLRRRNEWSETLFNAGQAVLQAATAGAVLGLFGWWDRPDPFVRPTWVIAVPLAGAALYLVNTLAVAIMIALQQSRRILGVWRQVALEIDRTEVAGHLAQLGFGVLAAVVVEHHPWALTLLVLPGVVVYSALSHHVELRLRAEERLIHQAFHDPLTDLPNRTVFTERLAESLAHAGDEAGTLAVLFLDLDRFKQINDTFGHEAGDRLLIEVATRLRRCLRPGDVVARLGGDEFTILLDDLSDPDDAARVADTIRASIAAPIAIGGRDVKVTTSIGILLREPEHLLPADLLRDADLALYRAKEGGRARAEVFHAAMATPARMRMTIEHALRRALETDELQLLYQPQVDLATGHLVGLEAILHWDHPERGLVGARAWLSAVEDEGLATALARRALLDVVRQGRRWADAFGETPRLNLDLPVRYLRTPEAADELARALAESGLSAQHLTIDVDDTALDADSGEAVATLQRLRESGIKVAVDHVGAGATHLATLAQRPISLLKLDAALVSHLDTDAGTATVVRATIGLGHALGWRVAADGITTQRQAGLLLGMGCTVGQGPFFAAPLNPAAVNVWLEKRDVAVSTKARQAMAVAD